MGQTTTSKLTGGRTVTRDSSGKVVGSGASGGGSRSAQEAPPKDHGKDFDTWFAKNNPKYGGLGGKAALAKDKKKQAAHDKARADYIAKKNKPKPAPSPSPTPRMSNLTPSKSDIKRPPPKKEKK